MWRRHACSTRNCKNNYNLLNGISLSGANAVRIVWWFAMPKASLAEAFTLDKIAAYIDKCKSFKFVPIVLFHDATVSITTSVFSNTIMHL